MAVTEQRDRSPRGQPRRRHVLAAQGACQPLRSFGSSVWLLLAMALVARGVVTKLETVF